MTPQQALEKLNEKTDELEKVGKLLIEKRKAYIVYEAKLIDAEQSARSTYFADKERPCKGFEFTSWLRSETWAEYAAERQLTNEIKVIQQQYDLLIELINTLKMSIRLMGDEMKNLNYSSQ